MHLVTGLVDMDLALGASVWLACILLFKFGSWGRDLGFSGEWLRIRSQLSSCSLLLDHFYKTFASRSLKFLQLDNRIPSTCAVLKQPLLPLFSILGQGWRRRFQLPLQNLSPVLLSGHIVGLVLRAAP